MKKKQKRAKNLVPNRRKKSTNPYIHVHVIKQGVALGYVIHVRKMQTKIIFMKTYLDKMIFIFNMSFTIRTTSIFLVDIITVSHFIIDT